MARFIVKLSVTSIKSCSTKFSTHQCFHNLYQYVGHWKLLVSWSSYLLYIWLYYQGYMSLQSFQVSTILFGVFDWWLTMAWFGYLDRFDGLRWNMSINPSYGFLHRTSFSGKYQVFQFAQKDFFQITTQPSFRNFFPRWNLFGFLCWFVGLLTHLDSDPLLQPDGARLILGVHHFPITLVQAIHRLLSFDFAKSLMIQVQCFLSLEDKSSIWKVTSLVVISWSMVLDKWFDYSYG